MIRKITEQLNSSNNAKLGIFFALYIAQSVPMSFFSTALQVMMRQASFSLSAIALLQLLKLPWLLKFLWAPYIDKKCVDYKSFQRFIIRSEIVYALLILSLSLFDVQSDYIYVLIIIFIAFIASATQDIATDALAVLSFDKKNKSMVNGMQSMGGFAGTLVGSGVLLLALHHWGWRNILPFLSLFALLALIPLWRQKKMNIDSKENSHAIRWADIWSFFGQKGIIRQLLFLVLYYAGIIGTLSLLRPYLVDAGYNIKTIGWVSGIVGTSSAVLMSYCSARLVKRFGRRTMVVLVALFPLATSVYFYYVLLHHTSLLPVCIGTIMLWSSYGMATVVVYTLAMDFVRKGREGTDFTIQTVLTHLVGILLALACGKLSDKMGYSALFIMEAALAFLSFLYVKYYYIRKYE